MLDGDLQDPPEAIPTLLDYYRQGYDVVYVQRVKRKEAWWLRACYLLILSATCYPVFPFNSRLILEILLLYRAV